MTRIEWICFLLAKITKYWLILFKIEVKKIILFVPMTGKKLIKLMGTFWKNIFCKRNYRHLDLYTLPTCCWICYSCFFLDEKVLMLPVIYEKYNYLLSMNINAEIYKFSFTEKNFSKCAHLLTFFQSLEQINRITSIHIKEHIEWLPFT
jgi:hypothetical protein